MRSWGWLPVLGIGAVLPACATAPPVPAPAPSATAAGPFGPLVALPACETPPAASAQAVEGLVLPDGSVVLKVQKQDPLTTVTAFTPFTPAQFEATYAKNDDLTVLLTENEVYEAELLVSNGTHRNFLKATATCSLGSQVLAVVAPEVDAEGLPLPQGATQTAAPTPGP